MCSATCFCTVNIGMSPAKFYKYMASYFISIIQVNITLSLSIKQSIPHCNLPAKLPDSQHVYYVSRSFLIAVIKRLNKKKKKN